MTSTNLALDIIIVSIIMVADESRAFQHGELYEFGK